MSHSTSTPPPMDRRNPLDRLNGSPASSTTPTTRTETTGRTEMHSISQPHLRNDSQSAYIKKEETSPLQRHESLGTQVEMEDVQADHPRQTNSTLFSPSVSISPNISDQTHQYSPAGSSPNISEQWSPQSSIHSTMPCLPSSLEESRRSHHDWASTVLHHDEQPALLSMIPPNPAFPSVTQSPAINHHTILPPLESLRRGTTPPRTSSWFTSFQPSPTSSPPSRRPDS